MPRIFYKQVELCQELPFEVRIPNAETLAAIREIEHHPERLRRYRNVEEMFDAWEADEADAAPQETSRFRCDLRRMRRRGKDVQKLQTILCAYSCTNNR